MTTLGEYRHRVLSWLDDVLGADLPAEVEATIAYQYYLLVGTIEGQWTLPTALNCSNEHIATRVDALADAGVDEELRRHLGNVATGWATLEGMIVAH